MTFFGRILRGRKEGTEMESGAHDLVRRLLELSKSSVVLLLMTCNGMSV